MDYNISTRYIDVEIVDPEGALQALQKQAKGNGPGCWSWVDSDVVASAATLTDALEEWCWSISASSAGVVSLDGFLSEKLGDDFALFKTLAPFVKAGGYIEMQGEDGKMWRWAFDGQTCHEQSATITWPDLPAAQGK